MCSQDGPQQMPFSLGGKQTTSRAREFFCRTTSGRPSRNYGPFEVSPLAPLQGQILVHTQPAPSQAVAIKAGQPLLRLADAIAFQYPLYPPIKAQHCDGSAYTLCED